MTLNEIGNNLSYPFMGLIVTAGLYLSFRLRFLQFPYLFLGLKIASGAMDSPGKRGMITPGRAFAMGAASSVIPGAIVGTVLAIQIAGPGSMIWIWITTILSMTLPFVSSTLSLRFRSFPGRRAVPQSGPAYYIQKALRVRWLAVMLAGVMVIHSLIQGNIFLLMILNGALGISPLAISSVTLGASLFVVLTLILSGGIRRIAWFARRFFLVSLFALIAAFVLAILAWHQSSTATFNVSSEQFVISVLQGFLPQNAVQWKRLIIGLAIYHVLTETGQGKFATIAGAVRTDYPAKQGLANMALPVLEVTVATCVAYLYVVSGMDFDLFHPVQFLQSRVAHVALLHKAWILFIISLVGFTIAGMGGWAFTGRQAASYLAGKVGSGAFVIIFLLSLLAVGLFLPFQDLKFQHLVLDATIISGIVASFIPLLTVMLLSRHSTVELKRYLKKEPVQYEFSRDLAVLLLVLMPKNLISRMFGWMTYIHFPRFVMVPLLQAFVRVYKINVDEAELQLKDYPSLNKFFTRALKEGARDIDYTDRTVVSPVDGRISVFGKIKEGKMIQAKGINYDLDDLLEWPEYAARFQGGSYIVIYLSPQDYHRIHTPHEGNVVALGYTPGELFTVNQISVKGVHGLFPKNERLTSYISTDFGLLAVCKVGATNVGRIRVTYDRLITNSWIRIHRQKTYKNPIYMNRGEELGRFEMGSTVILLFEKDRFEFSKALEEGMKIRLGEPLGSFQEARKATVRDLSEKRKERTGVTAKKRIK